VGKETRTRPREKREVVCPYCNAHQIVDMPIWPELPVVRCGACGFIIHVEIILPSPSSYEELMGDL
jgi:transcription elongation factor Elf1